VAYQLDFWGARNTKNIDTRKLTHVKNVTLQKVLYKCFLPPPTLPPPGLSNLKRTTSASLYEVNDFDEASPNTVGPFLLLYTEVPCPKYGGPRSILASDTS
jgi:hypothetical protein